ncbi:MAG: NAD-dependent epimerase/dehydratase family protein [Actinomyces sp.]|nr:MAG: NAD-dependent epimerase/dehydratase family protein [Actinomyces sp.]
MAHLADAGDEVVESGTDIRDHGALTAEFEVADADVVYHLAAQADVGGSWDSAVETLRVNVEGTLNVLAAARRAGVGRVLVVTSADVYGVVRPDELPLDESTPFRPVSPYAASKAAADLYALQAWLGHHQDVVRARSFNHLGPGQSDRFVASALASRVVANELGGGEVVRVGNLDARRDFTDVRDVVRAYRLLILHGSPGEAYNVCSGVDRPVREIAERLVALARRPMRLEADPALLRPVDLPVSRGDPAKLRAATGWRPEIDLDRTLADLLDDWRRRLAEAGPDQPLAHP